MSESGFAKNFQNVKYVKLVTYSGTAAAIKASAQVVVEYGGETFQLTVVIAESKNARRLPTLLGRDWLARMRLNWHEITQVGYVDDKSRHALERQVQ